MITNLDNFPEGLRVLAVDDDPVCLRILQFILKKCHYKVFDLVASIHSTELDCVDDVQVEVSKDAVNALKILRENKNKFDIVLTDVHMSDMDGFRLLEIIGLEMDIPVIMMSSNEDRATVMKGIEHGACDYLLKPIRLDVIKNIWQHVIRKSKFDNNDLNVGKGMIKRIASKGKKRLNSQIAGKDLNEDESNVHSDENGPTRRKSRVSWCHELHKKFMQAVEKLGLDKAVPSKILEEMNEPNLTREQVASHLQKYRTALKKTEEGQQKNNRIGSNEMNVLLTNVAGLSYNNQGLNGVKRLNDLRTNGPNSSQMNQYGHLIQKPDAFSHSFVNPVSCFLLPSQPNLSSQPFTNNLEVLDETCHRTPVHGPRDIYSDSVRMENSHHQSCLNRLSQSFSPRTNLCNGVMEVSSRMSGYNASNEPRPTSLPLGFTSNSLPVNNSFDFSDYSSIFDEVHLSNTSLPDREILPGLPEGIGLVHVDMHNSNVVYRFEDEELPLGKDCFNQLDTNDLYHLSSCSSTEDGLNEIVKQSRTVLR